VGAASAPHTHVASSAPDTASHSLAVKSAAPVAASVAFSSSRAAHTAPLCPANVPIQSPVSPRRSMGHLSWHAETRKTPSAVGRLYATSVSGRVCPGHTIGTWRFMAVVGMLAR